MPAVTIGLPFFNNRACLADTIRSVFAQTHADWELLLVDDGSTDGSLELADSIHDHRVRLFSDGNNTGLARRLNQIADLARGDVCLRLDADDLMHPTRTARVLEYFEAHRAVDAVFTGAYLIDEGGDVTSFQPVVERHTVQEVLKKYFNCHPTLAVRTGWARANPYPSRTRRAEDLDLWCRCFPSTTFGYIHDALYYSRLESGYSLRKYAATANDHCRVIMSYGPSLLGLPSTCCQLAKVQLKVAIHAAGRAIGLKPQMIRQSLSPVPEKVKESQRQIIAGILATPLAADVLQGAHR